MLLKTFKYYPCFLSILLCLYSMQLSAKKVTFDYGENKLGHVDVYLYLNAFDKRANKRVNRKALYENEQINTDQYQNLELVLVLSDPWFMGKDGKSHELSIAKNGVAEFIHGFQLQAFVEAKTLKVGTPAIEFTYSYTGKSNKNSQIDIDVEIFEIKRKSRNKVGANPINYAYQLITDKNDPTNSPKARAKAEVGRIMTMSDDQTKIENLTPIINACDKYLQDYGNIDKNLTQSIKNKRWNAEQAIKAIKKGVKVPQKRPVESAYNQPNSSPSGNENQKVEKMSEDEYFKKIQESLNIADWQNFIKKFPNGKRITTAEEKIWSIAIAGDSTALTLYTSAFPEGKYIEEAQKMICAQTPLVPLVRQSKEDGKQFTITFKGTCNQQPTLLFEVGDRKAVIEENWLKNDSLILILNREVELKFQVLDKTSVEALHLNPTDVPFSGTINIEKNNTIQIDVVGGVAPYILQFQDTKANIVIHEVIFKENNNSLQVNKLLQSGAIRAGEYMLRLIDQRRNHEATQQTFIAKEAQPNTHKKIAIIIAGILALMGTGAWVYKKYIHF